MNYECLLKTIGNRLHEATPIHFLLSNGHVRKLVINDFKWTLRDWMFADMFRLCIYVSGCVKAS